MKWCNIGENSDGAKAIFTSIGNNDSLEFLDLSNNGLMSSLGKSFLLVGLKANISLRIVDLSWNKLGDQAGSTLVEVLKINKNVQKIKLEGNEISSGISTAIDTQLSHNIQLHLKHAEMVSKSLAYSNELNFTKDKMGHEIRNLQRNYQDLEAKGVQEQESLIFELGRLGEQLRDKNQEYGALLEKLSLTSKALQVAEEKIEHMELVSKQRDKHFKQLQKHCASHEKAQQEVSTYFLDFLHFLKKLFFLGMVSKRNRTGGIY